MEKRNMICEYCKTNGHGGDICFKLHRVPDWFKELPNKKPILTINVVETYTMKEGKKHGMNELDLKAFIKSEMKKLINNSSQDTPLSVSHYSLEFVGNSQNSTFSDHCNRVWLLCFMSHCYT